MKTKYRSYVKYHVHEPEPVITSEQLVLAVVYAFFLVIAVVIAFSAAIFLKVTIILASISIISFIMYKIFKINNHAKK